MFLSRGDRDLGVAFQTHPGRQASISSEVEWWLPVARMGENGQIFFNGHKSFSWGRWKFLEMDCGDGCTVMSMCLVLLSHKKSKVGSFVVMQMSLESVTQSEVSQRKTILYVNAYPWNLKINGTDELLQDRNRLTHLEDRSRDSGGRRTGRAERGALTDIRDRARNRCWEPAAQPRELRSALCVSRVTAGPLDLI